MMRSTKRVSAKLLLIMPALFATGCMSWTPGWKVATPEVAVEPSRDLMESADSLFDAAGDAEQLRTSIAAYERAVRADPASRRALDRLAEANILYGAAYARGRKEKAKAFRAGIQWAERAMATNDAFRRRVEAGESVGAASSELGQDDMRPMLLWVTGVSYYFKECLSGPSQMIHFRWMLRTREVMERMLEVDPEFEHGAVLFSLAIYHIGAPRGAGRDMDRSAEYLERASAIGATSLLPRWGRAKYFYTRTGNREGFRRDLEWVLAQDPRAVVNPYGWAVYFQRDAAAMLREIDVKFR